MTLHLSDIHCSPLYSLLSHHSNLTYCTHYFSRCGHTSYRNGIQKSASPSFDDSNKNRRNITVFSPPQTWHANFLSCTITTDKYRRSIQILTSVQHRMVQTQAKNNCKNGCYFVCSEQMTGTKIFHILNMNTEKQTGSGKIISRLLKLIYRKQWAAINK